MPRVALHAVNLINPSHMEWTLDGRLLVSQSTAGSVIDITNGGDMQNATPYAVGLQGPASILPRENGEILVTEMWGGAVKDISQGGNVRNSPPWIDGLSGPYSLLETKKETRRRILVTESYNGRDSWLSEITRRRKRATPVVANIPSKPGYVGLTPLESWPHEWQKFANGGCKINWLGDDIEGEHSYLAVSELGQVMDITDVEGNYMDLIKDKRAIAWGLEQVGAIKHHPSNGLLYITQPSSGDVVALNPSRPQNYHFHPPVVKGLKYPTCVRFSDDGETMFVCDQADSVVWKIRDF